MRTIWVWFAVPILQSCAATETPPARFRILQGSLPIRLAAEARFIPNRGVIEVDVSFRNCTDHPLLVRESNWEARAPKLEWIVFDENGNELAFGEEFGYRGMVRWAQLTPPTVDGTRVTWDGYGVLHRSLTIPRPGARPHSVVIVSNVTYVPVGGGEPTELHLAHQAAVK